MERAIHAVMAVVETSDVPSILMVLVPRARTAKQGIRNLDLDAPFGWRQEIDRSDTGYQLDHGNDRITMVDEEAIILQDNAIHGSFGGRFS